MGLLDIQLFLGFAVDDLFQQKLDLVNAHLKEYFIKAESDYLHPLSHQGKSFLGKFVGVSEQLDNLKLLEQNIHSIAQKLVPGYNFEHNPLVLIAASK
jgi:5-methylcytosine-specific restriction endonuclease McrA